jgi:hypothetical protein
MDRREVLKLLATLLFVLAGGVLVSTASGLYLGPLLFGPADQALHDVSVVVVPLFLLMTMCAGMMLGVVVWILVWRPFLDRDEIESKRWFRLAKPASIAYISRRFTSRAAPCLFLSSTCTD